MLGSEFQGKYFENTKELADRLLNFLLVEMNAAVKDPKYSYEEIISAFNVSVSVFLAQLSSEQSDFELELEKFTHVLKSNARMLRKKIKRD